MSRTHTSAHMLKCIIRHKISSFPSAVVVVLHHWRRPPRSTVGAVALQRALSRTTSRKAQRRRPATQSGLVDVAGRPMTARRATPRRKPTQQLLGNGSRGGDPSLRHPSRRDCPTNCWRHRHWSRQRHRLCSEIPRLGREPHASLSPGRRARRLAERGQRPAERRRCDVEARRSGQVGELLAELAAQMVTRTSLRAIAMNSIASADVKLGTCSLQAAAGKTRILVHSFPHALLPRDNSDSHRLTSSMPTTGFSAQLNSADDKGCQRQRGMCRHDATHRRARKPSSR